MAKRRTRTPFKTRDMPSWGRLMEHRPEDAASRQRVIEALRSLSGRVDDQMEEDCDSDLLQLAIGSLLERLGVSLPGLGGYQVH